MDHIIAHPWVNVEYISTKLPQNVYGHRRIDLVIEFQALAFAN